MTEKYLLTLLLAFSFNQGCSEQLTLDVNNEIEQALNMEMCSLHSEDENENAYLLTIDEARQALLRERDFDNEEEKSYRDFLEGYPDGRFDYCYEDFVVIEIISFWPDEGDERENFVGEPIEFISQFECNLKEGLFRNITNVGSTFGRFRKNKHGEWIITIEGGSSVGSYGSGQ